MDIAATDPDIPRAPRRSKRRRLIVRAGLALVATPFILLGLSLLGFFPWSRLNCWQNDIDISSGRIRYARYLLWVPIETSVNDSALTKALAADRLDGRRADWHPVVTFSPGLHHSPHYRFHGAFHQMRSLEMSWESGRITPAARRASAERLLTLWRQSAGYSGAEDYVQAIWERAQLVERKGGEIDEADLPNP